VNIFIAHFITTIIVKITVANSCTKTCAVNLQIWPISCQRRRSKLIRS